MSDLFRPIIGIENRTAQEVFDIMCDRFRPALTAYEAAKGGGVEVAPRRTDETGWLVELRGNRPIWWTLGPDEEPGWITDSSQALRFARKVDAQAYIEDAGWTDAFASEHMWVQPTSLKQTDRPAAMLAVLDNAGLEAARAVRGPSAEGDYAAEMISAYLASVTSPASGERDAVIEVTDAMVEDGAVAIDALWSEGQDRGPAFAETEREYQAHCRSTARAALVAALRMEGK